MFLLVKFSVQRDGSTKLRIKQQLLEMDYVSKKNKNMSIRRSTNTETRNLTQLMLPPAATRILHRTNHLTIRETLSF